MPHPNPYPTDREVGALEALWAIERGTVALIHEKFNELHEPEAAYSTVLTLLRSLFRKGLVDRNRHGQAHVYWPRRSRDEVVSEAVDRLVNTYFGFDERSLLALLQDRARELEARRWKRPMKLRC